MSGRPTVISTFCGTGGSSLGYHWAGFKELLAIDFDAHAVECFKLNFPDVPIWHKSVTEITGQEILDFCKIKKGELDVFDGQERLPTIEEVLILCSFPLDWKMTGSFVEQWARLGNAVMPKFMQAIAETIKTKMLGLT